MLERLTLSLPPSDAPPVEFRIFTAGWNDTSKGRFLFDAAAARAVMAEYARGGVDLMLDLEHLSLDPDAVNYDPDARGWARLEVRDGELWAVGVTWTPDGAMRLTEKRQRYVSPAFKFDPKSRRVQAIHNIAITGQPATYNTPALVAASTGYGDPMTAEQLGQLAEMLGLGADAAVEDVLAAVGAMMKKITDSVMGGEPADAPAPDAPPPDAAMAEQAAAATRLLTLSARPTLNEALADVEVWRASHLETTAARAKLALEQAALEAVERRGLVGKLVELGAETPATAFTDPTRPPEKLELCERLAREPIAGMRTRVAALSARAPSGPLAPKTSGPTLSDRELAMCAELKIDATEYAARKAAFLKG